jgi:hypothetical protein
MDRELRLLLEVVVEPRTQESATKLIEDVANRLAQDCWPSWSSDGRQPYLFALTVISAILIRFIKSKGGKWGGRPKQPQVVADYRLRY